MSNSFTTPNFTDLIRLTEAMILAEPEINQELLDEVHEIYDKTNDEVNISIGKLEFIVFFHINSGQASLNKEIEIDGRNWKILDLYGFLDQTNQKLVAIVLKIAKQYNLDLPLGTSTGSKVSF